MTFALPWRPYNTSGFGMKGAIAIRQPCRTKHLHWPLSGREPGGEREGVSPRTRRNQQAFIFR